MLGRALHGAIQPFNMLLVQGEALDAGLREAGLLGLVPSVEPGALGREVLALLPGAGYVVQCQLGLEHVEEQRGLGGQAEFLCQ